MTAGQNHTEPREDIDLLLLAERTLAYLKRFGWLFLAAVVLGLGTGYLFYKKMPTVYQSRLVLHSYILTNPEQLQLVSNWDRLLKQKEYKTLAAIFNCPEQVLHGVKQLRGKEIQQAFTPTNPNGFTIDAQVTNNDLLAPLQAGIVYAFDNSEYVRERLATKRASLEELISKTSEEVRKLDSTKKMVEGIIGGSQRSSSSLIVDGSSINRQLIEMNEKLLGFRESLRFINGVQVLQGFSKFSAPSNPKLIPWLFMGLLFCLCLTWAGTLAWSLHLKLKARKQARSQS